MYQQELFRDEISGRIKKTSPGTGLPAMTSRATYIFSGSLG